MKPLSSRIAKRSWYRIKAALDTLIAAVLLVPLGPVMLLAAVAVRLESPGPVLFRQKRIGRNTLPFEILKLRTMMVDPQRVSEQTFGTSAGVTRIGRWLRRTKIDELPQLMNVLRGDMSLVGPRPCLPELLREMEGESLERFHVRPGLTGWAQIHGNVLLSWPERWALDVWYVRRCSPWLDAFVLFRTFGVIAFGERRRETASRCG